MSAPAVHLPVSSTIELATPLPGTQRLPSLDVFRGLVILAMLLVNNIGDAGAVGYFWSHADWKPVSLAADFKAWMAQPSFTGFPLFHHCTLADFVMPMFMLIIGIAIPFSAASQTRRGVSTSFQLWKAARRGATLYALGWLIDCSLTLVAWLRSTNPDAKLSFTLGMNVLQLLGVGYFLTRLLYLLPLWARLLSAALLFAAHFSLLKFLPQGPIPAGTFTAKNNAVGYLYHTLPVFHRITLTSFLGWSFAGMLSAVPATATMLLGTFLGDSLKSNKPARTYLLFAFITLAAGIALSFFLPMNKPRWTPGYLLYCTGVGTLLVLALHLLLDSQHHVSKLTLPLTVLGTNAIGIYVLSILFKIYCLNLPGFTSPLIKSLQAHTNPQLGSWLFTLSFVTVVWLAAALAYRKNWIWKV